MEGANQTFCEDCLVPLSVKHVLTECPNFNEERNQHFNTNHANLSEMVCETGVEYGGRLYRYLETIDYLDKI